MLQFGINCTRKSNIFQKPIVVPLFTFNKPQVARTIINTLKSNKGSMHLNIQQQQSTWYVIFYQISLKWLLS
jgi:hypothetical protein